MEEEGGGAEKQEGWAELAQEQGPARSEEATGEAVIGPPAVAIGDGR